MMNTLDMPHDLHIMSEIMRLRKKYDLHMKVGCYVSWDEAVEKGRKYIGK
ncbi:MAG: hypothetical protein HUJ76_11175 [Parasporobacterium sp.]|nr:hypothetical protein [Parasporobacterium sp.]